MKRIKRTIENISITKDDFKKFNKYELKKFMNKYRLVFVLEDDGHINLFINKEHGLLAYNHRFKGWTWWKHRDCKIYVCNIPKTDKLINTIFKYFKHRILN